jgi:hypothetical protein
MPYIPRAATKAVCAHCNSPFEKKHASRKYCSNTCNVQASYARNGRAGEPRATRADLEQMLAKMMALMNITPELATTEKPAPKTVKSAKSATKPAAPAAKAAATKPKKTITKPAAKAATSKKKGTKPVLSTQDVEIPTKRLKYDDEGRPIERISFPW